MQPQRPTIELLSGDIGAPYYQDASEEEPNRKRYWRQFTYTFLFVAILGLAYTWLRPPVYQSTAILRAYYDLPGADQGPALIHEQLVVHQQRLVSYSLVDEISTQLKNTHNLGLSSDDLANKMNAEAIPDSRLIKITAENSDPARLLTIMSLWTELYLKQFKTDLGSSSVQARDLLNLQLETLESQIEVKRNELENFRQTHEILSLERDESRVLNKIQSLGVAIDTATEEAATANATLKSIKNAMLQGKTVVRPQDQRGLDNMEARAIELLETLKDYEQKYTPEYMALDPEIVAAKNKVDLLRNRIAQRKLESQKAYLEEAEHALITAKEKEFSLKAQFNQYQETAQAFSTRFEQYSQLSQETEQLEAEAQLIRAELTKNEVRQPHQTRLELLEPPFLPKKPVRPDYWRDTLITLIVSTLFGLLSSAFLYLTRSRPKPVYARTLTPDNYALAGQNQDRIVSSNEPLKIANILPKELSHEEISRLLQVADDKSRLLILLLLSGLQPEEITALRWGHLDINEKVVRINHQSERIAKMPNELARLLDESFGPQLEQPDTPVFSNHDEINALISCTCHDANLDEAEQVTPESLWHTYIADFVRQGLMLSELYKIGGHIPPERLNQYRALSPAGDKKNLLETGYLFSLFSV